ncbi:ABC transporter substrate-binding protein [Streptomyces sp. NPDC051014]|uniref:ABC transporter substrate-binding protein n=1 Tax=Streptomyces sp. NPDC051014 TaxID=3155751 RepID=UPI0033E734EA
MLKKPIHARRLGLGAAALALLSIATTACDSGNKSDSSKSEGLEHLQFQFGASTAGAETANVIIAKYLGYYKQQGIDADFAFAGNANVAENIALLKQNKAQIGFVQANPLLNSAAAGKPLGIQMICNTVPFGVVKIVVPENSGIHDIKDLVGKKVGVSNVADVNIPYIKAAMQRAGVSSSSTKFAAIGTGAVQIPALRHGVVDAVAATMNYPVAALAAQNGFRILPDPPGTENILGPGLAAVPSWVASHKTLAAKALLAANEGTVFAMANPEATVRILWKMYPASKPAGMSDKAALAQVVPLLKARLKVMTMPAGKPFCNFDQAEWQTTVSYLGLQDKIKDYTPFYTNEFVQKSNDFDAAAIREQAKNFKLP